MNSTGGIVGRFNQDMIAPAVINARSYKSIFTFSAISDIEGTTTYGRIVDKSELPKLNNNSTDNKTAEVGNSRLLVEAKRTELDQRFNVTVESHTVREIVFQLHFYNPNAMSKGNQRD